MNIGCHLSIAKGIQNSINTAQKLNASNFQFFTRNPRGGKRKDMSESDIQNWAKLIAEASICPIVAHLPYTVNAASPNEKTWDFACQVIKEDLERMNNIGIKYLVMHPGNYVKSSLQDGQAKIIKALEKAFDCYSGDTILCLETMAGKGTEIGRNLDEIASIINSLGKTPKLGVCLDSCHLFASGYDFRNNDEVDRLVNDIDKSIGLDKVYLSHLNDSLMPCGSYKDRHACIGQGEIGFNGILNFISHKKLKNLPFILETPVKEEIKYKDEISQVQALLINS